MKSIIKIVLIFVFLVTVFSCKSLTVNERKVYGSTPDGQNVESQEHYESYKNDWR